MASLVSEIDEKNGIKEAGDMEDEVLGFKIDGCFGSGGCPNKAIDSDGLPEKLERTLAQRNLKDFLKGRVKGPLKFHHEFRVSISHCPNACSQPQIVDMGLIGACRPGISTEACEQCDACLNVCREQALRIDHSAPVINDKRCISCGQCIDICPTGTLVAVTRGFRILLGGKLGRHPRLAKEIPNIYAPAAAADILDQCLDHYQAHCLKGERFGEILERTGWTADPTDFQKGETQ